VAEEAVALMQASGLEPVMRDRAGLSESSRRRGRQRGRASLIVITGCRSMPGTSTCAIRTMSARGRFMARGRTRSSACSSLARHVVRLGATQPPRFRRLGQAPLRPRGANPRPTVEASRWSPRRTARATLEQRGVRCGDTIDCGVCHMAPFRDLDGKTLMLHHPRR
jgi:hypothetical protein